MTKDEILALVDELETKARAATPGPYEASICDMTGAVVTQVERGDVISGVTPDGEADSADAEYYAALAPDRVLALVGFVRKMADSAPAPTPGADSDGEVDWEVVRDAVGAAVERTSLREMAQIVGVSRNGISRFIGGAAPYQKSRRKYLTWFLEQDGPGPSSDVVLRTAVGVVLRHVPPARRDEARRVLSDLTAPPALGTT